MSVLFKEEATAFSFFFYKIDTRTETCYYGGTTLILLRHHYVTCGNRVI